MSIKSKIKQSPFLRGIYEMYRCYLGIHRRNFGYVGKDALLIPPLRINGAFNIYMHEHTKIVDATISATNAKFIMKRHSAAAEGLSVHTGNHMQVTGVFYRNITEDDKRKADKKFDRDIIVEEDVWIGCNVTLLCGAHLGRGSIIAAGTVVNKEVPPYCVFGGVPGKFLKFKWTIDQILEHEAKLYEQHERFTKAQLKEYFEKYRNNKD